MSGALAVAVPTFGTRLVTAWSMMFALLSEGSIRLTQRRNAASGLTISMLECLSPCWRAHSRHVVWRSVIVAPLALGLFRIIRVSPRLEWTTWLRLVRTAVMTLATPLAWCESSDVSRVFLLASALVPEVPLIRLERMLSILLLTLTILWKPSATRWCTMTLLRPDGAVLQNGWVVLVC